MSPAGPAAPPPRPARARHPWLPDVKVGFAGDAAGYGRLARRLVDLERILRAVAPTSPFRCHRPGRRLSLVGDVPLGETAPLAGLARVGGALGMRVACALSLPSQAEGHRSLPALARAGGVTVLLLDLAAVPAAAARAQRRAVSAALAAADRLGLEVEVHGSIPVVLAAGALQAEVLDRQGVTVRPAAGGGGDRRAPAEIFVTVDGRWYADERTWRRGGDPVGSVHDGDERMAVTLRRVLAAHLANDPAGETAEAPGAKTHEANTDEEGAR